MSITDMLTILAILVGPIAAVQVQKWKEKYEEKKQRKLNIFKTLMATRGARLSFEHVRALNMIDIEFHGEKNVLNAWKDYLDTLCQEVTGENLTVWSLEKDKLFVDLLSKMAKSVGYEFDNVHLKNAIYIPIAHGKEEEYQQFIRDKIKKIFSGEQAIPMEIISFPSTEEAKQKQMQTIVECLSGQRAIKVKLEKSESE